jgi:hypothetical protein
VTLRHPKTVARGCVSDGGLGDQSDTALRIFAADYRSGLKDVITGLGAVIKIVPHLRIFSEEHKEMPCVTLEKDSSENSL